MENSGTVSTFWFSISHFMPSPWNKWLHSSSSKGLNWGVKMKNHLYSCRVQVSKSAVLLIVRKLTLMRVLVRHTRIFLSVVINGEIFLFPGCTYQCKGKGKTIASSGWYNPSGDLSVTVIQVIQIGQIKRLWSTFLFMVVFQQFMDVSSYWLCLTSL